MVISVDPTSFPFPFGKANAPKGRTCTAPRMIPGDHPRNCNPDSWPGQVVGNAIYTDAAHAPLCCQQRGPKSYLHLLCVSTPPPKWYPVNRLVSNPQTVGPKGGTTDSTERTLQVAGNIKGHYVSGCVRIPPFPIPTDRIRVRSEGQDPTVGDPNVGWADCWPERGAPAGGYKGAAAGAD